MTVSVHTYTFDTNIHSKSSSFEEITGSLKLKKEELGTSFRFTLHLYRVPIHSISMCCLCFVLNAALDEWWKISKFESMKFTAIFWRTITSNDTLQLPRSIIHIIPLGELKPNIPLDGEKNKYFSRWQGELDSKE